MSFEEYSKWMGGAAVIALLAMLFLSRILRNAVITKPKLQKGALIFGVTVSAILLTWGIIVEIMR